MKNLDHLQDMLAAGELVPLDLSLSEELDRFIDSLPWDATRIVWDSFPDAWEIQRTDELDERLAEVTAEKTAFGNHTHAIAFYSGKEPCLAGERAKLFSELSSIFWTAPGMRFVFAADVRDGRVVSDTNVFMVYDDVLDTLHFSARR